MGFFDFLDTLESVLSVPASLFDVIDSHDKRKQTNAYVDRIISDCPFIERHMQLAIVALLSGYAMKNTYINTDVMQKNDILIDLLEYINKDILITSEIKDVCLKIGSLPVNFNHVHRIIVSIKCTEKEVIRLTKHVVSLARESKVLSKSEKNFIYKWKRDFGMKY